MTPTKTPREIEMFNRYKHWLSADYIPPYIIRNYNMELSLLKIKDKYNQQ